MYSFENMLVCLGAEKVAITEKKNEKFPVWEQKITSRKKKKKKKTKKKTSLKNNNLLIREKHKKQELSFVLCYKVQSSHC